MSGENNSQEIDQGSFTDDFLANLDSAELVSQDGGEKELAEVKEKTEKTTEKKETPTEPEDSGKKDDFEFYTQNESGERVFDTKGAFDFFNTQQKIEIKPPIEEPGTQTPQKQNQSAEISEEDIIRQNLLSGIDLVQKYVDQGFNYEQAREYAKRDLNMELQTYIQNKRFDERLNGLTNKEKQIEEKTQLAEKRPISNQNLNDAAKTGNWGTRERLEKALFTREIGGDLVLQMFKRENPAKKFESSKDFVAAIQNWFVGASADKATLQLMENYARGQVMLRNLPHLINQAKDQKETVDKSKKEANISVAHKRTLHEPKTKNEVFKWLTKDDY